MSDVAERASSRTDVPKNHECCCAVAETLADVGTGSFLTYCVQAIFPQNFLEANDFWGAGEFGTNPRRFSQSFTTFLRLNAHRDASHFVGASKLDSNLYDASVSHEN